MFNYGKTKKKHTWIVYYINPRYFNVWWIDPILEYIFATQLDAEEQIYYYYYTYWYWKRALLFLIGFGVFLYAFDYNTFMAGISISYSRSMSSKENLNDDPCIDNRLEMNDRSFKMLPILQFPGSYNLEEPSAYTYLKEEDVRHGFKEIFVEQPFFSANAIVGFQLIMNQLDTYVQFHKQQHLCVCFSMVNLPFQGGTFKGNTFMNVTWLTYSESNLLTFTYGNTTIKSPAYGEIEYLRLGRCSMTVEEIKNNHALASCMVFCGATF